MYSTKRILFYFLLEQEEDKPAKVISLKCFLLILINMVRQIDLFCGYMHEACI